MILKNRRTRETLKLTYPKFRKRFATEIQQAFESFKQTQLNKTFYGYKDDNMIESNFYFNLQYNFNNFGNSAWYIEKI